MQISKWVRWESDVNEFTREVWKKTLSNGEGEVNTKPGVFNMLS